MANYKQLLDEIFVITLTETLIILDLTNTESNNCFIHCTKQKKSCLCFFTDGKQNKACELDMITLRNHAPWSYTTGLHVTLSVVTGADFENSLYAFVQSEKR